MLYTNFLVENYEFLMKVTHLQLDQELIFHEAGVEYCQYKLTKRSLYNGTVLILSKLGSEDSLFIANGKLPAENTIGLYLEQHNFRKIEYKIVKGGVKS